jgi:hypothetical protein
MIDTFEPDLAQQASLFEWAMGEILDRDPDGTVVSDDSLIPMGAYLRLINEWEPGSPVAPTLLIKAGSQPGWAGARPWSIAETVVTVPADHFSILEGAAALTAGAVQTWLADTGIWPLAGSGQPRRPTGVSESRGH